MTLMKMGLMGAAVVGGLVGASGTARADVRPGFAPGRMTISAPVRRNIAAPPARFVAPPPARVVVSAPPARVQPVRYERYRHYDDRGHWTWDRRPIVVTTPTYTYGVYGGEDPGYFASQINSETAQAVNDLQFDVQNGVVRPEALNQMAADQNEISRDLAEATSKGYITQDDRAHLEAHVQEIRDLRDQFRC
jgi:hypothetical protein